MNKPLNPDTSTLNTVNLHSVQSVYRERLLEHLLIGELLKHSWLRHDANLEVSQPSIDRSGHDLVLEDRGITRHVQLKASSRSAKTSVQKIHLGLGRKPSGCVIWIRFDERTMELGPFLFFGESPGKPLHSLEELRMAKHTKGDATGVKKVRPEIRVLQASKFQEIKSIEGLYNKLFGVELLDADGGTVE
ncbi:MAG TPA: hypothetical protein VFT37_07980 [Telluria sp.]|nr:hypothetical protein [Telluria sp.]